MSLRAALTSFAQGSYTENTLSFAPSCGMFFLNERESDGDGAGDYSHCVGVIASDTDYRNACSKVEHGSAGRSEVGVIQNGTKCYSMVYAKTGVPATGTLSMDATATLESNGFITTQVTDDAIDRIISALMLGGDDIKNQKTGVFNLNIADAENPVAVTGLGFKPDVVIFFGSTLEVYDPVSEEYFAYPYLGWACADGSQGVSAAYIESNQFIPQTVGYQRTSSCIAHVYDVGQLTEAAWTSMDSDGFTVTPSVVGADSTKVYYIAIKGGNWHAGSFNTKTSTGTQATTGVGFQPVGFLAASYCLASGTSIQAHALQMVGCGLSASQQMVRFQGVRDNVAPQAFRAMYRDKVVRTYRISLGAFVAAETADLVTLDGDGWTLNYTAVTATAKEVIYLAFGDKATVRILGKTNLLGKTVIL